MVVNANIQTQKTFQLKIVYWGPGESGKTTNYKMILNHFKSKKLNKGIQIATSDERTLWNDTGFINFQFKVDMMNYDLIIQIVTCTGQERFLSTREYVIGGADGIIFVGDSDPKKMDENIRSYNELLAFIADKKIPWLIQLNKRDLENAIPVEEFKRKLNLPKINKNERGYWIVYPAITPKKENVIEIFSDLLSIIIENLLRK
jgi:signal recognition particle receptor subunit beta